MPTGQSEGPSTDAASTSGLQAALHTTYDPSLVDPLDTSEGPLREMSHHVESDAIFAWRDRQTKKQNSKAKEQRQADQSGFTPPPPYIFSASNDDTPVATPQPAVQPLSTPNIQGILDTIRHRRRSSAASMRSDVWRHDQSALDTASLASEEIHVSYRFHLVIANGLCDANQGLSLSSADPTLLLFPALKPASL